MLTVTERYSHWMVYVHAANRSAICHCSYNDASQTLSTHKNHSQHLANPQTTTITIYGPFSGTTRVSRCQKRTSGLYGAREN